MTPRKRTPAKKAAEVEVAEPMKVASTRVDQVPGTQLEVRAASLQPRTSGVTHSIQTTMEPWNTITVDDVEYAQLLAQGFVYSGSPVAPAADGNDLMIADKVQHGTATKAALGAAYGLKAGPNTWTGTQDFAGATVTGISGGSGGGPITSSEITDATTVGKAVLTATDAPTARTALGAGTSSFSGAYSDLSGKPSLAAVATSGAYADLTGRPTIPAGPTIVDNGTYVTMTVA